MVVGETAWSRLVGLFETACMAVSMLSGAFVLVRVSKEKRDAGELSVQLVRDTCAPTQHGISYFVRRLERSPVFVSRPLPPHYDILHMHSTPILTLWCCVGWMTSQVGAVVVGLDTSFGFRQMCVASSYIQKGALFLGTNPDVADRVGSLLMPGTGPILASIQTACGVRGTVSTLCRRCGGI